MGDQDSHTVSKQQHEDSYSSGHSDGELAGAASQKGTFESAHEVQKLSSPPCCVKWTEADIPIELQGPANIQSVLYSCKSHLTFLYCSVWCDSFRECRRTLAQALWDPRCFLRVYHSSKHKHLRITLLSPKCNVLQIPFLATSLIAMTKKYLPKEV